MDKKSTTLANKASAGKTSPAKQPITQSNWDLLTRYGHLDNTRTPAVQGYQIVDEVRALPSGPMERQHNPLVVSSDGEPSKTTMGTKTDATVAKVTYASKASTARKGSVTTSSSSGPKAAGKTFWSEEEIDELVRLRCHGLTYPQIAEEYLPGRDLKAIQLKFAKLKKISPYKERWDRYKGQRGKKVKGEDGSDGEGDADDSEPPDDVSRKDFSPGGSGSGDAQGGAQAVQVR